MLKAKEILLGIKPSMPKDLILEKIQQAAEDVELLSAKDIVARLNGLLANSSVRNYARDHNIGQVVSGVRVFTPSDVETFKHLAARPVGKPPNPEKKAAIIAACATASQAAVARKFGVSESYVSMVLNKKT